MRWVRVHHPGVGTYSIREDVPVHEDAHVLDGVEALRPDGTPIPDVPEAPLEATDPLEADSTTQTAGDTAGDTGPTGPDTTPGDDQAGTPGKTRTKE